MTTFAPVQTYRTFDLSGFGRVGGVARVPDGWLFLDGEGGLRLLRPDGTNISLPAKPARVDVAGPRLAIAADGRSIAWVEGTTLSAARLTSAGLQDVVPTPVPENSFALTWIGRRVVLGQVYAPGCCGYGKSRYDLWDPTRGPSARPGTPTSIPSTVRYPRAAPRSAW